MPHERISLTRIPLTLNACPDVSAETVTDPLAHLARPGRARWAAAGTDFIEGLRGERTGDPLTLLADVVALAANAELVCVIGPHVIGPHAIGPHAVGPDAVGPDGDLGTEEAFVVHAAHDRSARQLDGLAFPAAGSLCDRAIATGRPFLLDHDESAATGPESLLLLGPTLVVPVVGAGDSGRPALALTASRPCGAPPFTVGDLESAAEFARLAHAGLLLERSRADQVRQAVRADRARIAAELHDQVIQRVFATGLAVQGLLRMTTDPVLGQRLIAEVAALDAVIVEIRTAIFALSVQAHPDRPGVRRRVLDLLDELGPLFPHPPRVLFSGAIDLLVTAPLADDLVAVVREGLTNVVRHARTRDTEVSVSALADTLTIEISDDGVGLSGSDRCSGIANLSARAERWRGTMTLTDRAPGGTVLRWSACLADVPVRAAR